MLSASELIFWSLQPQLGRPSSTSPAAPRHIISVDPKLRRLRLRGKDGSGENNLLGTRLGARGIIDPRTRGARLVGTGHPPWGTSYMTIGLRAYRSRRRSSQSVASWAALVLAESLASARRERASRATVQLRLDVRARGRTPLSANLVRALERHDLPWSSQRIRGYLAGNGQSLSDAPRPPQRVRESRRRYLDSSPRDCLLRRRRSWSSAQGTSSGSPRRSLTGAWVFRTLMALAGPGRARMGPDWPVGRRDRRVRAPSAFPPS